MSAVTPIEIPIDKKTESQLKRGERKAERTGLRKSK